MTKTLPSDAGQGSESPAAADRRPSSTARFAALLRAMAHLDADQFRPGPDSMAHMFIHPLARVLIRFRRMRRWALGRTPAGTYDYVSVRTRIFDAYFRQAVEERFPQIVLLGAGYDTRGRRFGIHACPCRMFELDTPAVMKRKAACWGRYRVSLPDNLVPVAVKFGRGDWHAALTRAGYDPGLKPFVFWEGVSMYLTGEQVDETLAWISRHSGRGTRLAFDYFFSTVVEGRSNDYGAREQVEAVRKVGEPFRFGIDQEGIADFLSSRGLQLVQHYLPQEMDDAFLTDANGQCHGKVIRCGGIALAAHAG